MNVPVPVGKCLAGLSFALDVEGSRRADEPFTGIALLDDTSWDEVVVGNKDRVDEGFDGEVVAERVVDELVYRAAIFGVVGEVTDAANIVSGGGSKGRMWKHACWFATKPSTRRVCLFSPDMSDSR